MERPAFVLDEPVNLSDHYIGWTQAKVTVVEYGDFECPNCKQAFPAVKLLLGRFGERIRFVYRHFPLEEIHHHAIQASEAAESVGTQGKFWPMHDLLFENQAQLESHHLRSYAERLQVDMARYQNDTAHHIHLKRIRQHITSGNRSGVRSTPTFFLNGKIQDVSFGMQSLFDAVQVALEAEG